MIREKAIKILTETEERTSILDNPNIDYTEAYKGGQIVTQYITKWWFTNAKEIKISNLPCKYIEITENKYQTFLSNTNLDENKKVNEITKEERLRLVNILKSFDVTIFKFRPVEEAIVTAGGINIKEINPRTMESKIVSGLYFAGEVIDVDAYTGGFNLQIAYSTGYAAGTNN